MSGNGERPCAGMLAEFRGEGALCAAARAAREHGYTHAEAYAPFPVEGLPDILGMRRRWIAPAALAGGLLGGAAIYFLQWYAAVVDYPLNIGGRPLHSWPAFIPATFEVAILGAAFGAAIAMLWLNGLPRLYHPLFEVEEFELASRNRFYLFLPERDPVFAAGTARDLLEELDPLFVCEVPG
ncbi:DUF3341 domain-containing protein [Massilia sp. YIM B02763]|uniref:DUF3341 domain-containing protein n=1 Tax=Massilia sp. YIM B02763 TaxID=3050130 RepID=UPI0025B6831A|nr:DUF3341 domain-containing protein [Massilia sp. YIM B02763]MDN4051653.1 DUF3341 domain-containing protein [Massilia sp. YIM B02763]